MTGKFIDPSKQVRDMIELPTPCGFKVYYPANLAILATQGKYSIFHTLVHESGTSYLVLLQPTHATFKLGGNPLNIMGIYEDVPWKEIEMIDSNGIFSYKVAPSLQEMNDYFKDIIK